MPKLNEVLKRTGVKLRIDVQGNQTKSVALFMSDARLVFQSITQKACNPFTIDKQRFGTHQEPVRKFGHILLPIHVCNCPPICQQPEEWLKNEKIQRQHAGCCNGSEKFEATHWPPHWIQSPCQDGNPCLAYHKSIGKTDVARVHQDPDDPLALWWWMLLARLLFSVPCGRIEVLTNCQMAW